MMLGLAALVTGCVRYPLLASFEDVEECYIGVVDSNLVLGSSVINAIGETNGSECKGKSRIIAAPTVGAAALGFGCAGQIGEVAYERDDRRKAAGESRSTSCSSGYGEGSTATATNPIFTSAMREGKIDGIGIR